MLSKLRYALLTFSALLAQRNQVAPQMHMTVMVILATHLAQIGNALLATTARARFQFAAYG